MFASATPLPLCHRCMPSLTVIASSNYVVATPSLVTLFFPSPSLYASLSFELHQICLNVYKFMIFTINIHRFFLTLKSVRSSFRYKLLRRRLLLHPCLPPPPS